MFYCLNSSSQKGIIEGLDLCELMHLILILISLILLQYPARLSQNQVVERILYIYAKLNPGLGYVQVRDLTVLLFLILHNNNNNYY